MSKSSYNGPQALELLLGITLISTSGVLSRIIDLPAPIIIWLRCVIAFVPFYVILMVLRSSLKLTTRQAGPVLLSGVLMGAHWVTYFYALEFSSVAIGMLSLFTYPIFVMILEPLFLKSKLKIRHVGLAVIAFVGIYMLVPEFSMENRYTVGVLFGVVSAIIYSFRNILVKIHVQQIPGETLMFYQVIVMAITLAPSYLFFPINIIESVSENALGLILLALVTTVAGHSLFVRAFKNFSATTVSLVSNLTPLLGILLAWLFVNETPTGNVYIGGTLIMLTIVLEGLAGTSGGPQKLNNDD